MWSGTRPVGVSVGPCEGTKQYPMHVRWGARPATMRVCCVTTVLAALALRTAAEPAPRRFPAEWRSSRDLQLRSRPLHEIFEPDSAPSDPDSFMHQPLHKDRRRMRTNKRTPHIPAELASQMMLRASRSGRPYDVPQIGKFVLHIFK